MSWLNFYLLDLSDFERFILESVTVIMHACFLKFIYLIYLFLAALGLCCCARAFSSCSERGATLHCWAWASHRGGFSGCGAPALGT